MTAAAPPRVLVADDQSDVVTALRLLLRCEGFNADAAASIDEVRHHLAARPYDLLLMDLNYARDTTSGREGLELLTEVHARDEGLPVIVMTGWGSIDTAVEAMRRGARTFVHKPWDNAQLVDTVRREIHDGHTRRASDALIAREREDAQRVQRALLPAATPPLTWGRIAARWIPAATFGGDCYDVLALDNGSDAGGAIGVTIADVAGKGLPAALLMAHLQASVRAFAAEGLGPAVLAARTNASLCHNAGVNRFVTFFYAAIEPDGRRLTYCNAGHNAPILLHRDGAVERLEPGGMVLGVMANARYAERSVTLAAGDRLVLFTDGVTEATAGDTSGDADPHDDDFGEARLIDTIRRHRALDAEPLVDAIAGDVARFAQGPCADDVTVLVLAF